jgi:hypothetical protein
VEQLFLADELLISPSALSTAKTLANPHSKLKPKAELLLQWGILPIFLDCRNLEFLSGDEFDWFFYKKANHPKDIPYNSYRP